MAKVYFTLEWGFSPEVAPVVSFRTQGAANTFIRNYQTGDWVVSVGTKTEQCHDPEDRGRLLGMQRVVSGAAHIDVADFLKSTGYIFKSSDYNDAGEYRWPHGFIAIEAVRFIEKPLFSDLFPDYKRNGMYEAGSAVEFSQEMAEKVLGLKTEVVELKNHRYSNIEMNKSAMRASQGGSPRQTENRSGSQHDLDAPHWVYLFAQGQHGVKVGVSNDVARRLGEINKFQHLTGDYFEIITSIEEANYDSAFALEQFMLDHIDKGEFKMTLKEANSRFSDGLAEWFRIRHEKVNC